MAGSETPEGLVREDVRGISAIYRPWEETEHREMAAALKDTDQKAAGCDVELEV